MTANELYKVIEPIALWKPLFASCVAELLGEQTGTGVREVILGYEKLIDLTFRLCKSFHLYCECSKAMTRSRCGSIFR